MDALPSIVGIGASAGGLEALKEFVAAVPNDTGVTYVVVQHLAPDQPSLMDKLLGEHAALPVSRIEDGAAIEPDRIYLIPPGPFLAIEDGRFKLIEHDREAGVRTPIDRFLSSLADAAGREAFAVVLSGTGSDGTMGVRAIKTHGGIAIVQESTTARFPGMPDSAAATGLVDFVLPPRDIPGKILDIVAHRRELEDRVGRQNLLDEAEGRIDEILASLGEEGCASFHGYKPGTLVRRIVRRMTLLRQSTIDGYLRTLAERADERRLLAQDFLIGVTQFFRDPEAFEALKTQVFAPLFDSRQDSFRIWVPGCSTGEEAYSLAILVEELKQERQDTRPWKIFGTDIDLDALRFARHGRFSGAALEGLDDGRRERFFVEEDGDWKVDSRLREMCVFAPHNLLQDPPFSKLDLVSCRNVMIYLNADSQEALLPRFHYALNPGGFLWLGPSETLGRSERYFRTLDRGNRIFRRDDSAAPGFSAIARGATGKLPRGGSVPGTAGPRGGSLARKESVEGQSEQAFLRRFAAPFATVNRQNEVVYVSEAMTALVRPSRGVTSTALDDYLTQELRLPVHTALVDARRTGAEAKITDVVVQAPGGSRVFDVHVSPVEEAEDLMLVALVEVRPRDLAVPAAPGAGEVRRTGGEVSDHAQELLLTQKRLAALEQEYEAADQGLRSANEELLSMNEELQSSNEELETSREELQSINEELETINAELTENNRQLVRANSDLKNLLESTDIATLFIDQSDRVRLFTPAVGRLIGVQERDIGRSIHDLAFRVAYPELEADAAYVRRSLQPVEREVRIEESDETFSTRMRPYRTVDNRLDGVVITFVDVTRRKRNEREIEENARALRERYAELEQLYDTAPVGLNLLDRDLRYLRINARLAEINGYPVDAHIGRLQEEMLPETHREVADSQRRVFETGEPALGVSVKTETPAEPGRVREFLVDYYPVRDGDTVFAIGSCVREVTLERELERRIAESEARLSFALETNGLGAWDMDLATGEVETTPTLHRIFGNAAPVPGWHAESTTDYVLEEDRPSVRAAYEKAIADGGHLLLRYRIRRTDGAIRWVEVHGRPVTMEGGAPVRLAGTIQDVTERVVAREREEAHRKRLQRLLDSLHVFAGLLDPDGTLTEANAVALERGGLSREDVIGRKFWECWWWSFSEESQERLRAAIARAAQGETVRYDAPARMADGAMIVIDFQLVPNLDAEGRVIEIVASATDVTERVRAEERKDLLLAELEHRVKNTLAVVQSITRFTARMAQTKDDMAQSLLHRLLAISRTHDALTEQDWAGQGLRALVEAEVAPYAETGDGRFVFSGDDVYLPPRMAMSLGLALHELATNAAKHGAFSDEAGRVEVTARAGPEGLAFLEWREAGGPPVSPPGREGFGSYLMQNMLQRDLRAEIRTDYAAQGLHFVIDRRGNSAA